MMEALSMKTLIIIPTYNESENLCPLLGEIFSFAPETHVLIVDDNSPDGTGELAEEIQKGDARVHTMRRAGLEHDYEAVLEMDADFSHDPRYLPDFLKAIEDADIVVGSRYIPGGDTPDWPRLRRLISGSGNLFARFMLRIPVRDCTSGFRCYRRGVLQSIDLDAVQSHGYAFQVELIYQVMLQGFKFVEVPIVFPDRRHGTSKMSHKIIFEAFAYVLRTRLSKRRRVPVSAVLDPYTYDL